MFAFEAGSLSPIVLSGCLGCILVFELEPMPSSTWQDIGLLCAFACGYTLLAKSDGYTLLAKSKLSSPDGSETEPYFPTLPCPCCILSFGKLCESIAKGSSKS